MQILDGKKLATQKIKEIQNTIKSSGLDNKITLACILVGDDPASQIYIKQKENLCKEAGINSKIIKLDKNISKEDLIKNILYLNKDNNINGILLQIPLPEQLRPYTLEIINNISPLKDVDCLTYHNLGKLYSGDSYLAPCTATGIMDILDGYHIPLQGRNVTIVGRSLLVGRSVASLLNQRNATVTLCHSKTKDLRDKCRKADIIISATGKEGLITEGHISPGAVVIDAGIIRLGKGLVGDVDFGKVAPKCSYITPVPGGVGPMTVLSLVKNTLKLFKAQKYILEKESINEK